MDYPWVKEYPSDFLSDFVFLNLSFKDRGILWTLRLHAANNKFAHGRLVLRQGEQLIPLTSSQLAMMAGIAIDELETSLSQLVMAQLIDRGSDGEYFFKKMVSERELTEKRAKAGKIGGKKTQFAKAKSEASAKAKSEANSISNSNSNSKKIKVSKKNELIILPFSGDDFAYAWGDWKEWRQEHDGFIYDSARAEKAALTTLKNKSGGDPAIAIEMINESISRKWTGFYPKTKKNDERVNEKPTMAGLARAAADEAERD